jgi:hypothetical protein
MKYKNKYFETYNNVVIFLNDNKIDKQDIIAITPTTWANNHYDNGVHLIWVDKI